MNVELLRKIAAVIQEKPEEFRMSSWHFHTSCQTMHCIGGWAEVLSGEKESTDPFKMAALLDIQAVVDEDDDSELDADCEAARLFYHGLWPNQFRSHLDDGSINVIRAAARIEHFIATGGAE